MEKIHLVTEDGKDVFTNEAEIRKMMNSMPLPALEVLERLADNQNETYNVLLAKLVQTWKETGRIDILPEENIKKPKPLLQMWKKDKS